MRKTMWKDRLTGVSWRIDVPSKSRHISEVRRGVGDLSYPVVLSAPSSLSHVQLSEPTSIVELKVAPSQGKVCSAGNRVVLLPRPHSPLPTLHQGQQIDQV